MSYTFSRGIVSTSAAGYKIKIIHTNNISASWDFFSLINILPCSFSFCLFVATLCPIYFFHCFPLLDPYFFSFLSAPIFLSSLFSVPLTVSSLRSHSLTVFIHFSIPSPLLPQHLSNCVLFSASYQLFLNLAPTIKFLTGKSTSNEIHHQIKTFSKSELSRSGVLIPSTVEIGTSCET